MTPHLRGHVRAYVDRALPPALLHVYDRHLVCCAVCRDAADRERRIVAALRSDTGVPTGLRSSLLGLAAAPVPEPVPASGLRVPLPPLHLRASSMPSYDPVPTVHPSAPALHRSPMRAAVVASIAAGASVAAAWGLAASPISRGPVSVSVPVASFGASTPTFQSGEILPVGRVAPTSRSVYGPGVTGPVAVPTWVAATRRDIQTYEVAQIRFGAAGSAQSAP